MKKEERALYNYNLKHKIDENGILLKQCSICEEWFPCTEEYFYKNKSNNVDGLHPYCKECCINKGKMWNINNPKEMAENSKKFYERNKEDLRDYYKVKHNKKREIYKQNSSNWQKNNPEKLKQYRLKREQNKTHIISKKEWEECLNYFNNTCAYCGLPKEEHYINLRGNIQLGNFHKEHVSHIGENDLSNCVPSCKYCNSEKHTSSLEEWYNEDNIKFTQERFDKIHNWLNEDYKQYIKKSK